jgi:hypothetical protein
VNPACCLGVTGHRRLDSADSGVLRAGVADVLIAAAAAGPRPPRLATSLAEGADRLVAEVALALGYQLWCPLPFAAAEYERDFSGAESIAEFRALLARADVTTMAQQPGAVRDASYTRAGRAVLSASSALLALWDGQPARGEGGTAQIVAEALELRLPVIWLPVVPPHRLRVRLAGAWQDASAADLTTALATPRASLAP